MPDEQNLSVTIPVDIEAEMKKSYLDYSMSVIIGRALPEVRDGLKPVHRRILYGMYELGLTSTRDRKSTRLNSSHLGISYAVFCLKTKTTGHILTLTKVLLGAAVELTEKGVDMLDGQYVSAHMAVTANVQVATRVPDRIVVRLPKA